MSGGSKPGSKWYISPNATRNRKRLELTLPPEVLAKLDALGEQYGSRSAAVEALVMAAKVRTGPGNK